MNTQKKVFEKLFSSEKVELASEKFEFGVVQDDIKVVDNAEKSFDDAFGLISSAKQKAIPNIKNAIAEANKFLTRLAETKKVAKELGIDLPKEYLGQEQRASVLIGEANDIITWLNKY
jgi:hypothetical protein